MTLRPAPLTTHHSPLTLILGGLLTALAFPLGPVPTQPPFALWPLAWVGLAPLLAALLRAELARQAAWAAFVFACAWFFVAGVWVFRLFDALGWVLIWVPVGWVMLFGVAAHVARRAGVSIWLSWPLLWIAIEFLRSEWTPLRFDLIHSHLDPLRFSWLVLGHSRISAPLLAQTADLWGGYGLSLAPFLANLALAQWWYTRRLPLWPVLALGLLVAVEAGYGAWALRQTVAGVSDPGSRVPVGVVQSERESLPVLIELSEQLLQEAPQTRVVVWPEESFSERPGDLETLRAFARRHDVYLAVGCEHPVAGGNQNLAYWVTPAGEVGVYHKRERVPFIELHEPAKDAPTFPLMIDGNTIRVGIAICYDMDFPATARTLAQEGAELILMPSLDEGGWGGTQHAQHALLPRLRAIENRRAVVEASSSGVSQIIDAQGRVLREVPYRVHRRPARPTLYLEGTAHAVVQARGEMSIYTRGGHLFAPAVTVMAGAIVAWGMLRRSRP